MWTNFIDAAGTNFCRGLNAVVGHFPAACLVNGGQPALFLATVTLCVVVAAALFGWKKLQR